MPHKGFYTQAQVILLRTPVNLDAIGRALDGFRVLKRIAAADAWPFGGPGFLLAYRPEANGLVCVDLVERAWPDDMGDPQADAELFGAWAMGQFGPFAYPQGLARAMQQAWSWPSARAEVPGHSAFLRVRSSYVLGSDPNAKVLPPDYDALGELTFVTRVAAALSALPQAICHYNPNGERLNPPAAMKEMRDGAPLHSELRPVELGSNTRLFQLGGHPSWSLMDTVGMSQLDIPDHEACFQSDAFQPQAVDQFLFNAAVYILKQGNVIQDGDTMDGPGGVRWEGQSMENGLADPPRTVIRWLPRDGRSRPDFPGAPG